MEFAPIALFVYRRVEHTGQTIESLKMNELASESDLIIFSDSAKNEKDKSQVESVRQLISGVEGFKSVKLILNRDNKGLANSLISGITEVVNEYGKIIVLEDDMITSRFFLRYMNNALNLYEQNDKVISIHGYVYPVMQKLPETFFLKGADCWGWATWQRGWKLFNADSKLLLNEIRKRKLEFEFDIDGTTNNLKMLKNQIAGKVDSWAIRWHASAFINEKLTLYPGRSLVRNIGMDDMGTHTKSTKIYETVLSDTPIEVAEIPIEQNLEARKAFKEYFKSIKPNFLKRYYKSLINYFSRN